MSKPFPSGSSGPHPTHHQRHPQRNQTGPHRDPYDSREKAPGIEVCEVCGLVHHAGRWFEGAPPLGDVKSVICPACRRVKDRYPAGTVILRGFPAELGDELRGMVKHAEQRERAEHPLERLMGLEERNGEMRVTTTGMHLARCIGQALERRFRGGVTLHYGDGANELLVEAQHCG